MLLKKYLAQNRNKWPNNYDFANKLGISTATLSCIINGKNKPSKELAVKIEIMTDGEVDRHSFFNFTKAVEANCFIPGSPLPKELLDKI